MGKYNELTDWLLRDSDPAILYQVNRDLLKKSGIEIRQYQQQIFERGWGKELLKQRQKNGHWGNGFYNPKWTCTHYVLYELVQLEIASNNQECKESALSILSCPIGKDGGINYAKTVEYSDVCINGMILTIISYFDVRSEITKEIIDYLLRVQMDDGGWNCVYYQGAKHSSLHTTISVIEGLQTYIGKDNTYRKKEIETAVNKAVEFILKHQLFKSERTGEVIKDEFFKYFFPIRWKYDILRCLDLFRKYNIKYDERMDEALKTIEKSCNKNGKWKAYVQAGKTYFVLEKPGSESKWNTLRALRVLIYFKRFSGHTEP
jgi:hypothetical protein